MAGAGGVGEWQREGETLKKAKTYLGTCEGDGEQVGWTELALASEQGEKGRQEKINSL